MSRPAARSQILMPVAQKTLSSNVGSVTVSPWVHLRTLVFQSWLAGVFTTGNVSQGGSQTGWEENDSINELSPSTMMSASRDDREMVMFQQSPLTPAGRSRDFWKRHLRSVSLEVWRWGESVKLVPLL